LIVDIEESLSHGKVQQKKRSRRIDAEIDIAYLQQQIMHALG
jgi:hypothetical protein